MRSLIVMTGMRGWICDVASYDLPAGLVDEQEVTVIEGQQISSVYVAVRDGAGRQWIIMHWQVSVGYEYNVGGHYRHESDPMVIAFLYDSLAADGSGGPVPLHDSPRRTFVATCRHVLSRNG